MKSFRLFALATTVTGYLLIFFGGLVRVSGAGLGCPDWPKCFGRWIPPFSAADLPGGIDPSTFNVALAWIEYFNRLFGMVLGILMLITGVLALIHYRREMKILIPTVIAGLLVALVGWQGGAVVSSALKPVYVTVHLMLAVIVVSLLTYITQQASYKQFPSLDGEARYHDKTHIAIIVLWGAAIVQAFLGTEVRSEVDTLRVVQPLLANREFLGAVSEIKYLHILLGLTIFFSTAALVYLVLGKSKNPSPMVRYGTVLVALLMMAQIPLGIGLVSVGIVPILQVFHLWSATVYIGTLLFLFGAVRHANARYE